MEKTSTRKNNFRTNDGMEHIIFIGNLNFGTL